MDHAVEVPGSDSGANGVLKWALLPSRLREGLGVSTHELGLGRTGAAGGGAAESAWGD